MAFFHSFPVLFLTFILSLPCAFSNLTDDYYKKSCPRFAEIMQDIVMNKQMAAPTTAAATLRIFFHDCMVHGCDASILIASNAFNKGERDTEINLSLPGDGFDVVTRAKTALELECPGVVSCSDILAVATRNLIKMVGGPFYNVLLGRKDSTTAKDRDVDGVFPLPTMTMSEIISKFTSKGLTIQEMVALSGAHTIGFSHCKEFSYRIFNFSTKSQCDPALNPVYAQGLQKLCANYTKDTAVAAFNDVMTPGKFDNMYYQNLQRGLGLLASDNAMWADKRTKPFVNMYAANETKFFEDFSRAMEKLSAYMVETGNQGEVRRRCDTFNTLLMEGNKSKV